jgi:crotonobetainyl-CoA:carnitine CoA-transferase CaiB-like acyl-CoA transferase
VRRYSSADVPPAMDVKRLGTAPEWFTTPSTVSAATGMHRFVWPLHYPAPAGLTGRRGGGGSGAFADGVWAPPGNYRVVLTVNGQKFTQPLTVVPDPRVNLPSSAYAEQFAFAREVEQTRATLAAALAEASALVKRKDIPDALRKKATEVSGVIEGDDFTAPPPAESSLRFLNQQLAKLAGAIDSADAAPTADARASWAKLKPATDAALTAWAGVKGEAPPVPPK